MKAAISRLNQSGLKLDDEAVRTIQAASRPDWNPSEQLVLVTIPDLDAAPRATLAMPTSVGSGGAHQAVNSQWASPPLISEPQPAPQIRADEPDSRMTLAPKVAKVSDSESHSLIGEPEATTNELAAEPPASSRARTIEAQRKHSAIVESLAVRFERATSFSIHFCDIDQPLRPAEVCLSVGMELAERMQRRILLMDVSRTSRPLSGLLGVDFAAGFREVIRTELNWRQLVRPTSHPLVEVLPAGVIKLNSAVGSEQELAVRRLMSEVSQTYGGILTCADSAYDPETALVGMCSSGGFLTINFQRTSRGLAQAAARQLQATGNRLLGCIAASLAE